LGALQSVGGYLNVNVCECCSFFFVLLVLLLLLLLLLLLMVLIFGGQWDWDQLGVL
jgi:hypothetical protein